MWPPIGTVASRSPLSAQRSGSLTEADHGLTVGAAPIDPGQARRAVRALIAAYAAVHGRLPTKAAGADLYRMLAEPPRPELSAGELARARLKADRSGADTSPWRD